MPDENRRDLERRVAASPDDRDLNARLAAAEEREGIVPPPLSADATRELRDRALNQGDGVAEDILTRDVERRQPDIEAEDTSNQAEESDQPPTPPRRMQVSPVPAIQGIARKRPIWDRETFGDGAPSTERRFFQNPRYDAQGRPKTIADASGGWDNNVFPDSPFHVYRVMALVDAGEDIEQAEHFWNKGVFRLVFAQSVPHEWPARLILPPPRPIPSNQVARTKMVFALNPGVDVTVSGRPLTILPQEQWCVIGSCEGITKLSVMVGLLGIQVRSLYR